VWWGSRVDAAYVEQEVNKWKDKRGEDDVNYYIHQQTVPMSEKDPSLRELPEKEQIKMCVLALEGEIGTGESVADDAAIRIIERVLVREMEISPLFLLTHQSDLLNRLEGSAEQALRAYLEHVQEEERAGMELGADDEQEEGAGS